MTTPRQGEHAQTEALRSAEIIRDWCTDCRIPLPSDDECARLVAALTAQPAAPQGVAYAALEKKHRDFVETVSLMLDAIGYKEDYARQWPKEKASITFKRWFDEQRASNGQAPAGAADDDEVDLPDAEDMAHSALQEALSFGLSHDVIYRWMRAIQDQTVKAMRTPTAQAAPAAGAVAGPVAPAVPIPLADAQHLLSWMDEQFGNDDGDDWFDADAASVADGLNSAVQRFLRAHPPTPAAQADSVAEDTDPIRALIAQHAAILDQNESAYFELCYHRVTGWMAWITDKPLCMPPVINPDRKVLAQGQGDTADEACADAARRQGGV